MFGRVAECCVGKNKTWFTGLCELLPVLLAIHASIYVSLTQTFFFIRVSTKAVAKEKKKNNEIQQLGQQLLQLAPNTQTSRVGENVRALEFSSSGTIQPANSIGYLVHVQPDTTEQMQNITLLMDSLGSVDAEKNLRCEIDATSIIRKSIRFLQQQWMVFFINFVYLFV